MIERRAVTYLPRSHRMRFKLSKLAPFEHALALETDAARENTLSSLKKAKRLSF